MKALLIVLLVLVLLGLLKVGIHFVWDGGAKVQILVWKFRISFPGKKAKRKETLQKTAAKTASKALETGKRRRGAVKGWLRVAASNWQEILELAGKSLHSLHLDMLVVRITAGGADAADCALHYGQLWAAVGGVLAVLENTFRIGKREIQIQCGYDQRETSCFVQADMTVRIYELLVLGILGLKLLVQLYNEYQSIQKAVQSS